jgi:hypothetical protein
VTSKEGIYVDPRKVESHFEMGTTHKRDRDL